MSNIPDGYVPLITASPFNTNVGPYYCQELDDQFLLGLEVLDHHCNSAGRLHGGMICALADVAVGHNVGLALARELDPERANAQAGGAPKAPITTVSMSTDFVGGASLGDWVEVRTDVQRTGKTLAFANAYVFCGEERIARVSAVFRILLPR